MANPTFIGIGGQKCASTWLSECMRCHPQVQVSTPKEIRYFSDYNYKSIGWYLNYFSEDSKCRGEFSSNYIYFPEVAKKIRSEIGIVKIIAVVRQPSARSLSHIKHLIRDGHLDRRSGELNKKEVEEIVKQFPKVIENSKYAEGLRAYREAFGDISVFAVTQAACRSTPESVLRDLWSFLQVELDVDIPSANRTVSFGIVPKWQWAEDARRWTYAHAKRFLPILINAVRRTGLASAYRRLNEGNDLKLSPAAAEYIDELCADDWAATQVMLRHN